MVFISDPFSNLEGAPPPLGSHSQESEESEEESSFEKDEIVDEEDLVLQPEGANLAEKKRAQELSLVSQPEGANQPSPVPLGGV